jgi:hypothetical protein
MSHEGIGQAGSQSFMNPLLGNVANSASHSSGPSTSQPWLIERSGSSVRYALQGSEDDSLKWVAEHLDQLVQNYRDMWVVVQNRQVVVSAPELPDLMREAASAGIRKPFVLKIEQPSSQTWRTAFGHSR